MRVCKCGEELIGPGDTCLPCSPPRVYAEQGRLIDQAEAIDAAAIRGQRSALLYAAAECVRLAWEPDEMIDAPKAERRRLAAAAEFRLRAACDRLKAIADGLKPAAGGEGGG